MFDLKTFFLVSSALSWRVFSHLLCAFFNLTHSTGVLVRSFGDLIYLWLLVRGGGTDGRASGRGCDIELTDGWCATWGMH